MTTEIRNKIVWCNEASEEPASGTVIIGEQWESSTGDWSGLVNNRVFRNGGTLTASWAESAATTTAASIKVYLQHWNVAGNVKCLLYNGSTSALIAQTNPVAIPANSDIVTETFTFSSPPTITKGLPYILGIILDTSYIILLKEADQVVDEGYDSSGTYASPPDPVGWTDLGTNGRICMWAVH